MQTEQDDPEIHAWTGWTSRRTFKLHRVAKWSSALAALALVLSLLGWPLHEMKHDVSSGIVLALAAGVTMGQVAPVVLGTLFFWFTSFPGVRDGNRWRVAVILMSLHLLIVVSSVAFGGAWLVAGVADYFGCRRFESRLVRHCYDDARGRSCRQLGARWMDGSCYGSSGEVAALAAYAAGCEADDAISCDRVRGTTRQFQTSCKECSAKGEGCVLLGRYFERQEKDERARDYFSRGCTCGDAWSCEHFNRLVGIRE